MDVVGIMAKCWGLHTDSVGNISGGEGTISLGWDEVGDLRELATTRAAITKALVANAPQETPQRVASASRALYKFAHEMKPGDIVVVSSKSDAAINIGKVTGSYYYDCEAKKRRHRRSIEWLRVGVVRTVFSQAALCEFGSTLAVFPIRIHKDEVVAILNSESEDLDAISKALNQLTYDREIEDEVAVPYAEQIEQQTRDFIVGKLHDAISPADFERFIADLVGCFGYHARVTHQTHSTSASVMAGKDALGLEPPHIFIRLAQQLNEISGTDVESVLGAQEGHAAHRLRDADELNVLVTLGRFSDEALAIEHQRSGVRLLTGESIARLVTQVYDRLPLRWQTLIPLQPVLAVSERSC